MRLERLLAAGMVALAGAVHAGSPACSAQSPGHTVALVELYTADGCDTCPPADRWLSSLSAGFAPTQVVPLALHLDYRDYTAWKDPDVQLEVATRKRKLLKMRRATVVYTPQVLLQGRDFRGWGTPEFARDVAHINAQPQRARLSLVILSITPAAAAVELAAELADPALQKDAAIYLAAYEDKLGSKVDGGENGVKRPEHVFVVHEWLGPITFKAALGAGGRILEKRVLPLLPNADPNRSGVVAFAQDRRSGEVLQALMRPACAG